MRKMLAIHGGTPVRIRPFPSSSSIGKEEIQSVTKVLKSGVLSRFLGAWHDDFFGGEQVRAFENEWEEHFHVKHAIAVNSATSGLYSAVGALGIGPGDEVIVSPYTMSASATAPLIYGGIPVFADIEEDYFCLSPESIEQRITKYTKAIIVVDLFGQPYDADRINAMARKYKLKVIEDCAQAPGAKYKGEYAGTLGDIGVYSLNYHKHIHTGEGGMVVTNDDELAERVRLIRNHAEAVLEKKKYSTLINMVGFNYRMTEIEAAIGRAQLRKLSSLIKQRINNVEYLSKKLSKIPGLHPAEVRLGCKHVFYAHPILYDQQVMGITRKKYIEAVNAELIPIGRKADCLAGISAGYVKPLYLLPLYQSRIAFGKDGYPWITSVYKGLVSYKKGICPVAESMYDYKLISHDLVKPPMTKNDLNDVIEAFAKVWRFRNDLEDE